MSDTIIIDETYELSDGQKLHIVVDLEQVLTDIDDYHNALRMARGIPFDTTNLSVNDPAVKFLVANFPNMPEQEMLQRVRAHYATLDKEANSAAQLLAFFTHPDNQFNNPPTAYTDEPKRSLPGLIVLPPPRYNIFDPVEGRYKQIMDLLRANPAVLIQITQLADALSVKFEKLRVKLEGKRDDKGFRNKRADRKVHADVVSGDVLGEVQA